MAFPPSESDDTPSPREAGRSIYRATINVFLAGIAVIIPLIVTLYVFWIAVEFIVNALQPLVELLRIAGVIQEFQRVGLIVLLLEWGIYDPVMSVISELIAVVVLITVILAVGFVTHHRFGEQAIEFFDHAIAAIPGVGTIYTSFRRVGDLMTNDTVEEFEGVRLVRMFDDETYVIGFETNQAPAVVEEATGGDRMLAIFLPFAPNPVTGGFLAFIPEDRVIAVDMSVEDAVRNIITSGIAGDETMESPLGSIEPMDRLYEITEVDAFQEGDPSRESERTGGNEDGEER